MVRYIYTYCIFVTIKNIQLVDFLCYIKRNSSIVEGSRKQRDGFNYVSE